MAQAKGRPTDVQRNLRREKEKERCTCQKPSQFESVDRSFEKNKQHPAPSTIARTSNQSTVNQFPVNKPPVKNKGPKNLPF